MSRKRIFLTGASGFLGRHVLHSLLKNNYDLSVTRFTSPLPDDGSFNIIYADMGTPGSLAMAAKKSSPDVVLHIAAMTSSEACEIDPARANRINVESIRELLTELKPHKTRFIFISTDLVFDGLKGFYCESDSPNPGLHYAKTKLEAERLVQSWGKNYVILRLALMYGPALGARESFAGWLEKGLRKGCVMLFTDEWRTPLFVEDAAHALELLITSDFCGTLHLGGNERCSRYEFGIEFARRGGYDTNSISAISLKEANLKYYRPPDVSLDSTLAKRLLGIKPASIQEGIGKFFERR